MYDNRSPYIAVLCVSVPLVLFWKWRHNRTKAPMPPGPRGLPLLGNVLDIPRGLPIWRSFTSLSKKYNTDVLYLRLLTTDMVVLDGHEAVSDLSEKRSNIYSGRPRSPMLDLMGVSSWNIAMLQYNANWRSSRRLLHEFLNTRDVARFDEHQRKHAHRLLFNLAESPDEFFHHLEFLIGSLAMEMTYGINIIDNNNRFLRAVVEGLVLINKVMIPGAFLVDIIPILKYVPEWFPGAGFKTFAREGHKSLDMAVHDPFEHVKGSMKFGESGNSCIVRSCLECTAESPNQGYDESVIRGASATIFIGAVDTTASTLHTFFLAMALNQHVVKKAQEELDRVVGTGRIPDFSDKANLPYISAILKEVLRWGCPAPIGAPKRLMEDDVYKGYTIPAGAIIVENIWAMLYDESVYPEPYKYNPERFMKDEKLDPSVRDPEETIFGFGRRICPGKYLAMRTLFLNVACILSLFDIEAPINETLEASFIDGFLRHPAPFKCTIKPRSDASLKMIRTVNSAADC